MDLIKPPKSDYFGSELLKYFIKILKRPVPVINTYQMLQIGKKLNLTGDLATLFKRDKLLFGFEVPLPSHLIELITARLNNGPSEAQKIVFKSLDIYHSLLAENSEKSDPFTEILSTLSPEHNGEDDEFPAELEYEDSIQTTAFSLPIDSPTTDIFVKCRTDTIYKDCTQPTRLYKLYNCTVFVYSLSKVQLALVYVSGSLASSAQMSAAEVPLQILVADFRNDFVANDFSDPTPVPTVEIEIEEKTSWVDSREMTLAIMQYWVPFYAVLRALLLKMVIFFFRHLFILRRQGYSLNQSISEASGWTIGRYK